MPDLMLSPGWRAAHPEDEGRVAGWLSSTTSAALAPELAALAASRDLRSELGRLRCRVHARVGDADLGCPPAWSEEIARLARRASLELVPGCGHAILIEDLASTITAVARQIDEAV